MNHRFIMVIEKFAHHGISKRTAITLSAIVLALNLALLALHLRAGTMSLDIEPAQIQHEIGKAYTVRVKPGLLFDIASDRTGPNASRLELFENNERLSRGHSLHAAVRDEGDGRYSHWGPLLYFSASDSSNPITNGRAYRVVAPRVISSWFRLPVLGLDLVIAVFCAVVGFAKFDRQNRVSKALNAEVRPRTASVVLIAAATVLAVFLLSYLIGFSYKTNDDIDMRMTAEGLLAPGDDRKFLLFQNIIIGSALQYFYRLAPSLPWYDIGLTLAVGIGSFCTLAGVIRLCRSRAAIAYTSIASVVVLLPIVCTLQFTAAAIVLGGGAIILFLSVWTVPPSSGARLLGFNLAIAALFFTGSLFRYHGAFFSLAALGPLALLLRPLPPLRLWISQAATIFVAVAAAVAAIALNFHAFGSAPGWESYMADAAVRNRAWLLSTVDRSASDAFNSALAAARWTANDYELLSNWLYMDLKLFSRERLETFVNLVPMASSTVRIRQALDLLRSPEARSSDLIALAAGAAALAFSIRSGWRTIVAIVWFVGVLVFTAVAFRSGFGHILWPYYAVCFAGVLALAFTHATTAQSTTRSLVTIFALLLATVFAGREIATLKAVATQNEELRRKVTADMTAWRIPNDAVVVVWNNNFPYEFWAKPYHPIPHTAFQFLHTNDVSVTPLSANIYSQLGTHDIGWAMCHDPRVFIVDAGLGYAPVQQRMLKTYMREHFNESVDVNLVQSGSALSLYACRVAQPS